MRLAFSAPVARSKAMESILRGPSGKIWKAQLDEGQETQDFLQYITFKAPFPEKAGFSVELPKEVKDDAGRALVNADKFPLKIRTEEYPPLAKFPAAFGIIELKGEPILPVTLRNVEDTSGQDPGYPLLASPRGGSEAGAVCFQSAREAKQEF
jgi:hypothetical protein